MNRPGSLTFLRVLVSIALLLLQFFLHVLVQLILVLYFCSATGRTHCQACYTSCLFFSSVLFLYYKSETIRIFFTKIGPTVSLTEAPLVRLKNLTKERGRLVLSTENHQKLKLLSLNREDVRATDTYLIFLPSNNNVIYFLF